MREGESGFESVPKDTPPEDISSLVDANLHEQLAPEEGLLSDQPDPALLAEMKELQIQREKLRTQKLLEKSVAESLRQRIEGAGNSSKIEKPSPDETWS